MRNLYGAAIWLMAALIMVGCGDTTIPATRQLSDASPHITEVESSWSGSYDLPGLVRGADLIIEGTVASISGVKRVGFGIYTDYAVNIDKVLKSVPGFAEHSIVFRSQGGTLQGETQVVKDNGLYQVGDKVFLFLNDISDDVAHTPQGETKFNVMLLGGRFQIKPDGMLHAPSALAPASAEYRGKNYLALEKDVLANLPKTSDYVEDAAGAFLIVEGVVKNIETRQIVDDDTQNIYTYYSFSVDRVIQDRLVKARKAQRKSSKVYDVLPVQVGDVITVIERGGTYKGVTERHAWSQFMQSGERMLLFLGAMSCGDLSTRGTASPLCTRQDQDANKILYILGGGARFVIGSDNRVHAVTRSFFSRLYDGAPKDKLIQDLNSAEQAIQQEQDSKQNQPSRTDSLPPPPTETK